MKTTLFGLLLFFSATFVFSQADTIDFSMSFQTNPAFNIGLEQVAPGEPIFQVNVSVTDLNTVGDMNVMIYSSSKDTPDAVKRLSKEEVSSGLYTNNGLIVFNFPYLNSSMNYHVILEVQNAQQAYLPRIEKNFQAH